MEIARRVVGGPRPARVALFTFVVAGGLSVRGRSLFLCGLPGKSTMSKDDNAQKPMIQCVNMLFVLYSNIHPLTNSII